MNSFTIRVYGICLDEQARLLVSDEYIFGRNVTKFPGGGLHLGEGTIDCLKREIREECGQDAEVTGHFYTTDFFQPSAFDASKQVISIYYFIKFLPTPSFSVSNRKFDFPELKNDAQSFRWISMSDLKVEDFTLPVDRKVGEMLIKKYPDRLISS